MAGIQLATNGSQHYSASSCKPALGHTDTAVALSSVFPEPLKHTVNTHLTVLPLLHACLLYIGRPSQCHSSLYSLNPEKTHKTGAQ